MAPRTPAAGAPRPRQPRRRRRRVWDRDLPGWPSCPEWLDDEARRIWDRLVPLLRRMGTLTRADANLLARYCQTFMDWRRAVEFLNVYGTTYPCKSGTGVVKCFLPFPQVSIAQKLSTLLTKMERELGLTPAARVRMAG